MANNGSSPGGNDGRGKTEQEWKDYQISRLPRDEPTVIPLAPELTSLRDFLNQIGSSPTNPPSEHARNLNGNDPFGHGE